MKPRYTREQKIKYYSELITTLKTNLNVAQARLNYIMSDKYQDWNSDLQRQLNNKKKKKGA